MSRLDDELVFLAHLDPRTSAMAKAERKSQINSHSARLKYKLIKSSRVPSAADGTSYPMTMNQQIQEIEISRVDDNQAEVLAPMSQWSINELEDIFQEQASFEVREENAAQQHVDANPQEDEMSLSLLSPHDTPMVLRKEHVGPRYRQRTNALHEPDMRRKFAKSVLPTMKPHIWQSTKQLRWKTLSPWQIQSSLDPFVHLPIQVSDKEQSLLQFYLTSGRRVLHGTSERPLYCPTLQVASKALEHCPIYVGTHIAMAEHLLCKMQSSQVSKNFYRRRAEAYKMVNELILSETASTDEQISGLLHLQMVDYTIGRPDLQRMHITAMDKLIESKGGFSVCFELRRDTHTLVEPAIFAVQYAIAEFRFSRQACLEGIIDSFIMSLRCIRIWVSIVQSKDPSCETPDTSVVKPSPLEDYVNNLIYSWLRLRDRPYVQAASSFHFIYALCVTLAKNDFDRTATALLLDSMQYHMERSTTTDGITGSLDVLFSGSAACMLSNVRQRFLSTHEPEHNMKREVSICQSCIGAAKIFPFLPFSARLQLARNLAKCAFVLRSKTNAEFFEEMELEDLKVFIGDVWTTSAY